MRINFFFFFFFFALLARSLSLSHPRRRKTRFLLPSFLTEESSPLINQTLPLSLSLFSYAIVTLQATGHFTGKPYTAPAHPDWPSLPPTGKRFSLAPETVKVKVNNKTGKIEEIAVLPVPGGGPRGLYEALGGKVPAAKK